MFKWLTTTRKGFTLVELMVVLLLLSLGIVAIANLFRVAYRSFEKSEERYIKQEAVKTVATLLRSGSQSVTAAQSADIFNTLDVLPTGDTKDESYSYLYAEEHLDENGVVDGYYIYILDKGKKRADATLLSPEPIHITIRPYEAQSIKDGPIENQCGVIITLAALDDDYEKMQPGDSESDYIYYSLDVAYHFPNMVTSSSGITVNYTTKSKLTETTPNGGTGDTDNLIYATECEDYCSNTCGCTRLAEPQHKCCDCDCKCEKKQGIVLRVYCDSILSGDNTNTDLMIPKLCFIATASYGYDSGEVGLLCDFRDKCLLTNPLGTAFVNAYYKYSPPVADFIAESEPLKAVVRVALKPLVLIATNALDEDVARESAVCLVVFMLCGAGATITLIKVDKRRKKAK